MYVCIVCSYMHSMLGTTIVASRKKQMGASQRRKKGKGIGATQFIDLCQEEYWTAAGVGFTAPADMRITKPNLSAHMYFRKELADVLWRKDHFT